VHHNKPGLAGGTSSDAKGATAYVEVNPLHMLRAVGSKPVTQRDRDIIEEMAGTTYRSTWSANDANKIQSKDGVVCVVLARRLRPCFLAPIVDDKSTLEEVEGTYAIKSFVVCLSDKIVG
jgi:hypothetical protein